MDRILKVIKVTKDVDRTDCFIEVLCPRVAAISRISVSSDRIDLETEVTNLHVLKEIAVNAFVEKVSNF